MLVTRPRQVSTFTVYDRHPPLTCFARIRQSDGASSTLASHVAHVDIATVQWAFVELCRRPDLQSKLRAELAQYPSSDPTWDQLMNSLPYLDGVVHEVLRLHPALEQTTRVAAEPHILPLSAPLRLPDGTMTDRVHIAQGQIVTVPISCMNQSEAFWGPDSRTFNPERWMRAEGLPAAAQEIQGHRHLLTFVDGPRICIGRMFAITEFKVRQPKLDCNHD